MAHTQQKEYCQKIKSVFPEYFYGKRALDVGSLDVNGNNRYLFNNCSYFGIDIGEGNNVDICCVAHEFDAEPFDTIISTECLEHDYYYPLTLKNIIRLLKPGGLFLFTCATTGRPEHGTVKNSQGDAPLLHTINDAWANYYKNLTANDIKEALDMSVFSRYVFEVDTRCCDLYFYGIKK